MYPSTSYKAKMFAECSLVQTGANHGAWLKLKIPFSGHSCGMSSRWSKSGRLESVYFSALLSLVCRSECRSICVPLRPSDPCHYQPIHSWKTGHSIYITLIIDLHSSLSSNFPRDVMESAWRNSSNSMEPSPFSSKTLNTKLNKTSKSNSRFVRPPQAEVSAISNSILARIWQIEWI